MSAFERMRAWHRRRQEEMNTCANCRWWKRNGKVSGICEEHSCECGYAIKAEYEYCSNWEPNGEATS